MRTALRAGVIAGRSLWAGARALPHLARMRSAPPHRAERSAERVGVLASELCAGLGPAFVKLGQLVSTREDLLPRGVCRTMRDRLALGRGLEASGGPRARSGSIAAVERRATPSGDVAVKTCHPRIRERLEADLAVVEATARAAARLPFCRGVPVAALAEDFCAVVRRQTDLAAERAALERFASLEDRYPVVFPRPVGEAPDRDTLVMDWIPGQEGAERNHPGPRGGRLLLTLVFEMLFTTGEVHCDLHPGNWWFLDDGRLAVVDGGFTFSLDRSTQEHFTEFFLGMAAGNAGICADHALAVSMNPVGPEAEQGFRRDLERLITEVHGMTAGAFSLTAFIADFFMIQRRYNAYSRTSFVFPLVALLAVEGQVKRMCPELNFQAVAHPVILRGLLARNRKPTW
ncbi:AarF/UbiB family protein [Nocardiopsis flavescens]|uniref:Ubiquinone biosynthesis protein n=1 Tax=Nocardiopsis flavescens TaxID=758803 RepID=A0A1M6PPT4_9ACTN|nr:AarF/UbiB family protein [Nocardiopsis flavescens]SHK09955.1 ubiquinone biosynthesis protein [Nocardiopsis flavescens]